MFGFLSAVRARVGATSRNQSSPLRGCRRPCARGRDDEAPDEPSVLTPPSVRAWARHLKTAQKRQLSLHALSVPPASSGT